MRCSFLSFLPLSMAIVFLVIAAGTSFGSPTTNHIQPPKKPIPPHNDLPAQSPDVPNNHLHAFITTRALPDESNRHARRNKKDWLTSSNYISPALLQRHNHITDHLRLHSAASSSSSPPLTKRNLASDLTVMGFRLIWTHADVIVSSSLAYYRTTEYYRNMTVLAGGEFGFGPTVQNYVITYGVLRLTFDVVADAAGAIAAELAWEFPNGFGQFVQEFAQVMLLLTAGVVIGTYKVLAWMVTTAVWITMVIVENVDLRNMVSGH